MSPTFLQGGNAAVPYPSPAMRQPEASTPSMLRLPQRPSDIYTGRSRRSPPDALTLTSDRRRARDSIPDGTSTATTNGFVSSRPTASDMPPTTSTRSNDASSSEEGEVSEDEPMDVDTRTALPSATARGSLPEANVVPGDDFSIDERTTWYQGRSPNEPARPGVLDDSITVANYTEAQLLVLDILGWGIPSGELFRGFGISTTLLKTIFNDLQPRLPKDLDSQELSSSSPSQGEEPVLSSTLPSSLGTPPSSVGHDASGPIPTLSQSAQRASPSPPDAEPLRNPTLHQNGTSGGEATAFSSSGEELLKIKRSELLAQLRKLKAYRYYDGAPPGLASPQTTLKRSADDAFESSSELEYPSKRPFTVGSSTDLPLAASTPTPQPEVSGSASVASCGSVQGVGTMITWISPTPVKVNGHFCDVFEGTHSTARKVALKRPRIGTNSEDVIKRFQREAEIWARLQHPHILEYLGTFQRDGYFYFVSPFMENGTLVGYIINHPNVNRVMLLRQLADAINYLHQRNLVHGDIKADNILIGDNHQVLLCDFGLTRTADLRTSTAMKGAGTLRWQSPELWNDSPKSFKSDVYAFGMTIVEVLTGDIPFPNLGTNEAVMRAVLFERKRPPKNPTESSAGLSYEKVWAVAEACWPTGPDERISMSEALQLIQEDPSLTAISEI